MKASTLKKSILPSVFLIWSAAIQISGQEPLTLTLNTATDLTLQNNHLLNIKKLQIEEKQQVVNQDKVKYFPSVIVGGLFQYNSNLPQLVMTKGMFGSLPIGGMSIPLPLVDEVVVLGNNDMYNAGVTVYQPLTQIGKIRAGVRVSTTELQIVKEEEMKAVFQIKQSVEKLYFGLLILQKQIEESTLKVKLAESKLHDAENALAAGKTIESGRYGLAASAADEEQNLLKLRIQYDDYLADLLQLMGLSSTGEFRLEPVPLENIIEKISDIDTSLATAATNNIDLRLASLNKTKAEYAVEASKYSYLPELGLLGNYTYQDGNFIYPRNNAYFGASLKWNLQELFSNRYTQGQRSYLMQQAEENLANTKEQVNKEIARTYRKLKHSEELIKVASKVREFRREDLKVQHDRRASGMNLETDLLAAQAYMAKAESDYYAAQLNYRITLTELKILTGNY